MRYKWLLALLLYPQVASSSDLTTFERARNQQISGQYAAASELYRKVIDDPTVPPLTAAKAHNNLCLILLEKEDSRRATKHCRLALDLRRSLDTLDSAGLARTLNNLGLTLQSSGQLQLARTRFQEALATNQRLGEVEGEMITLSNLALVAAELGDYGGAQELNQRAEQLARSGEDTGWALERLQINRINQGVLLERLGAFDESLALYQEVLRSDVLGPSEKASARLNTGVIYRNLGDSRKALQAFQEAIETFRELGEISNLSNAWLNLGLVQHLNLRDLSGAEQALRKALALAQQSGEKAEEIQDRFYLGRILLEQHKFDEARQQFEACRVTAIASGSAEGRWSALEGLGLVAERQGALEESLRWLSEAIEVIEAVRGSLSPGLHRSGFFGDKRRVYESMVRVLAKLSSNNPGSTADQEALEVVQRAKSRELLESLSDHQGEQSLQASPLSARDLISRVGDRYLLELFIGEARLYAWRINEGQVRLFDLGPKAPILEAAESVYQALARELQPPRDALRFLSQSLLGPKGLWSTPKPTFRFIAPDGPLHLLPFEILPIPDELESKVPPSPLIKRYTVAYLPSASSLGWAQELQSPRPFSLVGFAPSTENSPHSGRFSLRTAGTDNYPPLAASARELESSARNFGKPNKLYLGASATEAAFREAVATGSSIVHLASHSVLHNSPHAVSAVLLHPEGNDDGLLTATELANLEYRADLTVLASCRSARGPGQEARGLTSLTGAVMAAGSTSTLATLWDVGDQTTAVFMQLFYEKLGDGLSPAEALRESKLLFLQDPNWAKPSLWSPYILIGDAPVIVDNENQKGRLKLTILALAIAGAFALTWNRRRAKQLKR